MNSAKACFSGKISKAFKTTVVELLSTFCHMYWNTSFGPVPAYYCVETSSHNGCTCADPVYHTAYGGDNAGGSGNMLGVLQMAC